jgi:NADH:ubiquinone oxidoreductase subunit 6 (subunit J)
MSGLIEWALFLGLSLIAVAMAAAMLLTMSMYRAGLALMSSFVALAGLFILLDADLLAAIQIMMNVGGMMVMILFMVMIMLDPGGEMMWDMKRKMQLPGPGAFSMSMPRGKPPEAGQEDGQGRAAGEHEWTCPMHPEVRQQEPGTCPTCGMDLIPAAETTQHSAQQHGGKEHAEMDQGQGDGGQQGMHMASMSPRQHYQMMVDMAMSTAQLPWALAIGGASVLALIILMVRTPWPLAHIGPNQDATVAVGDLLLSRYMIGFEGAAFLILAGMVGAVIFAKREGKPAPQKAVAPSSAEAELYTCPMHPEIRQRGPGECPICGMALTPAEHTVGPPSSGGGDAP